MFHFFRIILEKDCKSVQDSDFCWTFVSGAKLPWNFFSHESSCWNQVEEFNFYEDTLLQPHLHTKPSDIPFSLGGRKKGMFAFSFCSHIKTKTMWIAFRQIKMQWGILLGTWVMRILKQTLMKVLCNGSTEILNCLRICSSILIYVSSQRDRTEPRRCHGVKSLKGSDATSPENSIADEEVFSDLVSSVRV